MPQSTLVLEDDARICRVVGLTLRRGGVEMSEAAPGEEGLARLGRRPFDVDGQTVLGIGLTLRTTRGMRSVGPR